MNERTNKNVGKMKAGRLVYRIKGEGRRSREKKKGGEGRGRFLHEPPPPQRRPPNNTPVAQANCAESLEREYENEVTADFKYGGGSRESVLGFL